MLGTKNRRNRRAHDRTLGHDRGGEHRIVHRKMEWRRLLRFQSFELFLLAKLARDFTQRTLRGFAVGIESRGGVLRRRGGTIVFRNTFVFARFDFGLIFRREDLLPLEVFFRVNVLGSFLLFLFAGALLARGVGDALVLLSGSFLPLRINSSRVEKETSKKQHGEGNTKRRQDTARARGTRLEGARAV